MNARVKASLVFLVLLLAGFVLENMRSEVVQKIASSLPNTAWTVVKHYWSAALMTAAGAVVAFTGAICVGWFMGLCGAGSYLASMQQTGWSGKSARRTANAIFQIYNLIYLIPFVLTVTLTQSIMTDVVGGVRALFLLLLAGVALGGYQIFLSFYSSVAKAEAVDLDLVDGILNRQFRWKWFNRIANWRFVRTAAINLSSARRLRDCNIQGFSEAIERAWHLSIVAVMIVESLIGSFYEFLLPEGGRYIDWKSGLGGLVLSNIGQMEPRIQIGCIWIILVIDWIGSEIIRSVTKSRWLKYYD
jgi:hypothetical protein